MRTAQDIAYDILAQDNRSTASPVLLLLQVKKEYVAHNDFCNNTDAVYVENLTGEYHRESSLEALISWHNDGLEEEDKIIDWIEDEHYGKYELGHYWETVNVFFSDAGFEEHMSLNSHNYRKGEVRTYAIHAFRNPEMKEILETILSKATNEIFKPC